MTSFAQRFNNCRAECDRAFAPLATSLPMSICLPTALANYILIIRSGDWLFIVYHSSLHLSFTPIGGCGSCSNASEMKQCLFRRHCGCSVISQDEKMWRTSCFTAVTSRSALGSGDFGAVCWQNRRPTKLQLYTVLYAVGAYLVDKKLSRSVSSSTLQLSQIQKQKVQGYEKKIDV